MAGPISFTSTGEKFCLENKNPMKFLQNKSIKYEKSQKSYFSYSDFDGLLRLQRIFQNIPRNPMGEPRFHIDMARRISTVAEAIDFLLLLEKQNRDSVKHVVLDCSAQLAKDILVQHVRSVHLGRRNYHYLMSGLVLGELHMP